MKWNHKQSLIELLKHLLLKTGTYGVLLRYRRRRGFITKHLEGGSPRARFQEIYRLGTWMHSDAQESRSGLGSEASSTGRLAVELPAALRELGCRTLIDVGCGDLNWMANIELPCDYIGIDIVPELITANEKYARPGVRFMVANASEDELPKGDVALCREVLFHLSLRDCRAAIGNLVRSADWLIATSDTSVWFNSDIPTGDFRNLNLCRAPFHFPPPLKTIPDDGLCAGRILGVWRSRDLA